ncbi:MAG: hypothetical protein ACK53L_36305, partial [Pirellulaceae bacterium]
MRVSPQNADCCIGSRGGADSYSGNKHSSGNDCFGNDDSIEGKAQSKDTAMGTASIFTREDLANSGAGPDHPRVPIRWQRRRRWLAACLLSMTTLTGCSYHQQWWQHGCKVGPNYCKPTAPVA